MIRNPSRETIGQRLLRWIALPILRRIWYVGTTSVVLIQAPTNVCIKALADATKPNARQLQHRNLYTDGRRYFLQLHKHGFRMTTTRSVSWNYRRRTGSTTIMYGRVVTFGDDLTQIQLHARMNLTYLATSMSIWMTIFVISWLVYAPWNDVIVACLVLTLITLAWAGHRISSILDSNAMVWFVQRVLEEFDEGEIPELSSAPDPHKVVIGTEQGHDFEREWDKFYQAHKEKK